MRSKYRILGHLKAVPLKKNNLDARLHSHSLFSHFPARCATWLRGYPAGRHVAVWPTWDCWSLLVPRSTVVRKFFRRGKWRTGAYYEKTPLPIESAHQCLTFFISGRRLGTSQPLILAVLCHYLMSLVSFKLVQLVRSSCWEQGNVVTVWLCHKMRFTWMNS